MVAKFSLNVRLFARLNPFKLAFDVMIEFYLKEEAWDMICRLRYGLCS